MKIYFASDHAGFSLKEELVQSLMQEEKYEVVDCGPLQFDKNDDYPGLIAEAARRLSLDVREGVDSRAVVIGASGQGEAIVANRFKGVRCALYYGEPTTTQIDVSGTRLDMLSSTREHNNANALSLAARFLDAFDAKRAVISWLQKPFSGEERHARRIKQIDEQA